MIHQYFLYVFLGQLKLYANMMPVYNHLGNYHPTFGDTRLSMIQDENIQQHAYAGIKMKCFTIPENLWCNFSN